jgi:hypothetical protein
MGKMVVKVNTRMGKKPDYGKATYDALHLLQEDATKKAHRVQIKAGWMAMLQNARANPIIHVDRITPSHVMEGWISKQANQQTLKPLSSVGYGGKWTAMFHFFHVNNGKGPMQDFQDEMKALWNGFLRTINKHKIRAIPAAVEQGKGELENNVYVKESGSDVSDEEDIDDCGEFKEVKDPMSTQLYRAVCFWLLEWGTLEGIFVALFIVLKWNLVCCGNNTAQIWFSHLQWNKFDTLMVNFNPFLPNVFL